MENTLDESLVPPVLPAPLPSRGRLSFLQFARALRDSTIATFGQEAYERDIIETKMFGRRMFVVNDPVAIKHVLIDNAANYQKTESTRRILEPGLEMRARDPGNGPRDLLARLIAARDEHTGTRMSAQEVPDHVITIFLAGHETTAMAMTWTWFLLSQHPAQEAKLHAELDAVLGGRAPTHDDLSELTYSRMVVEESMRMYPPVHTIARQANAEDRLAGRPVPKGSTVMIVPGCYTATKSYGKPPVGSTPSGSHRSAPRRAPASRTCRSAAVSESVSVRRLHWLRRRSCSPPSPSDVACAWFRDTASSSRA
jgi:cytochrome P450